MSERDLQIIVAKLEERDQFLKEGFTELKAIVSSGFEELRNENKELRERIDGLESRVAKAESELSFAKRIGLPVLGVLITAVNAWIQGVIGGGN